LLNFLVFGSNHRQLDFLDLRSSGMLRS